MVTSGRTARGETQQLLSLLEITRRASCIRLLLTDCDGVLTDGGVFYSDAGEAMKCFSIRDGMGVELLRDAGIDTGIISGEHSGSVQRRAEKLALPYVFLGIRNKREFLQTLLTRTSVTLNQLAYIGDDVNDLDLMLTIGESGLISAPSDALPAVREIVHHHCTLGGGKGAFREFADWILYHRVTEARPSGTGTSILSLHSHHNG